MTQSNDDVWIIIPVFNEARVIADVVTEATAVFPHVVCVDDGSTDGSADQIEKTGAHLVRHPVNLGQGAALQTGLDYALGRPGARFFVTFDADGQHRVADVEAMVALARGGTADVVLGSRFMGTSDSVPRLKRVILRTVVALSPTAHRLKLTDAHNGLRLLTRPVAEQLRITINGMAHASEIVSELAHGGWRVVEVPVTILYSDYSRGKGQSVINGINILFDISTNRRRA